MATAPLPDTFTFDFTITAASGTNPVTILSLPTTESLYPGLSADYYVSTDTQLESLQATLNLPSLGMATTPNIYPEDTQAEKQVKMADVQSRFAKVGLALLINNGGGWKRRAVPILQNFGRETYLPLLVPYLVMSSVQLLGKADTLGVQITNLGSGVLGAGDSINISGAYRQLRGTLPRVIGVMESVGVLRQ